jgi:methyltransferase (TIGR00027 family)
VEAPPRSERPASRTALGVAALRATHQLFDDEPKILADPISGRLVGPAALETLRGQLTELAGEARRSLRAQVLLRSRFAEDRLADAVRRGVRQAVVLGAGLDTFAYRQPDWAGALRLFEVDHPASQADKRRRLAQAAVPIPANLDYVAIDFERVSLAEGLRASVLDFASPAFFTCLGVMVYLEAAAVDAIFALVAGFPAGSEIVFTFSQPGAAGSPTALRAAQAGEPWRSHVTPDTLRARLDSLGFSRLDILDQAAARAAYFREPRRDGLAPPARASIAAAMVG